MGGVCIQVISSCGGSTLDLVIFRHETILCLLRCNEALVQCFSKRRSKLDCQVVDLVNPILKQIWTSTLRVVGIKHVTDCGFSLLSTLLKVTSHLFNYTGI